MATKKKPKEEKKPNPKQVAMDKVIKAFDDATDPQYLTPQQYIEFTNELIADLQIRLESAVEEANNEDPDDE